MTEKKPVSSDDRVGKAFLAGLAVGLVGGAVAIVFCLGAFFAQNRSIRSDCQKRVSEAVRKQEIATQGRLDAESMLSVVRELAGLAMEEQFGITTLQGFQKISLLEWGNRQGQIARVIALKYDDPSELLAQESEKEFCKRLAKQIEDGSYDPKTGLKKETKK